MKFKTDTKKEFTPITVTITLESLDEVKDFRDRLNFSESTMKRIYEDICGGTYSGKPDSHEKFCLWSYLNAVVGEKFE